MKTLLGYLFFFFSWFIFSVITILMVLSFPFTRTVKTRRWIAHKGMNLVLKILGYKIKAHGLDNLIGSPAILVANHASYIDPMVLAAVLPPNYAFVAKKELKYIPFTGYVLSQLGTHLVDRFNARKGAQDMRRIMTSSQMSDSIIFFPEGTFHAERGLSKFKLGAFVTAIKNNVPVIPVAISGTRELLRSETWLPKKVSLKISVFPPIKCEDGVNQSKEIAKQCRELILSKIDEPDLKNKSFP
jgi:1-acyl-sn-glycerol-3-phosphate acyltransferase